MVNDTNRVSTDYDDDARVTSTGLLADPPMRGLVYHAVLYLGVVLVCLAVNLRIMPDILWVQWIALLWGLLLAGNVWAVLSSRRRAGGKDQTGQR